MSLGDALSALLAAVVWGVTFIAIKYGVQEAPPFLLSALRFAFAAFPAVLFVKPPQAPAPLVVAYGLLVGVGHFGLLFFAMKLGMPVGLASLVVQMQAFFTILFAWIFLNERPTRVQAIASLLALAGMCVIGSTRLAGAAWLPFALTLSGSACWGLGNHVSRFVGRVDPIAFLVWSSLVPPLPMLALSYALEGAQAGAALLHPSLVLIASVAMLSYGGTLIGYGLWNRLLSRYSAATVAPFALLVPVVGMLVGRWLFQEPLSAIEFLGALLVMAGLSFNVLGERLTASGPRGNE